jgi:tetratricopeptide (TPR) repeat protein
MAEEELLGGLLGKSEEEDALKSEIEVSGLDPSAAALAAQVGADHQALPPEAAEYYRKQTRLVEIQSEHLHEQRGLLMSRLRIELSHLWVKRFIDALRASVQFVIMVIATIVGLGLLVMLYDAFASHSVVVEPFDTPTALASRGLTGRVVANAVLDRLTQLQTASRGRAAKRRLTGAWTNDIKVEAPGTGVSIGEIDRILKARFGHDVRIDGDLVQAPDGDLALTIRGDRILPKTFSGGAEDLDLLAGKAAEYVYGQSQPASFAAYLVNAGRSAEAVAFSRSAYAEASAQERPYLLKSWGDAVEESGGDPRTALALFRAALALKPDYWGAWAEVMGALTLLGDEEGAWRVGEAMRAAAGGRPGRAPSIDYQNWDWLTWNLQAWRAGILEDAAAFGGVGSEQSDIEPNLADVEVRLHDPDAAALHLQLSGNDAADPIANAAIHFVRGRMAAEAGDTAGALTEMEAFAAAYANPAVFSSYPGYVCWAAPVEEAAGHPDKADQVLARAGRYVNCYRFKGDILDGRGDWAGAQGAYAAAVVLAPDLPAGHYSWGLALARHGDLAGAAAHFAAAHLRGPHWADPLKAWGDVLARQGRWREARAKYNLALTYAPAWSDLIAARAAAAKH